MTAQPGINIRLVGQGLRALEILVQAGGPVVSVEVNEGPHSVHPLSLSMSENKDKSD